MIRNLTTVFLLFIGSVQFLFSAKNDFACSIHSIIVEALPCDSMDMFFAELSFEYDDPGANGFLVRGNGVVYDTFEYGENSYNIGPLFGDCTTIYQFTVEDVDDPDCDGYYEFDLPVCCTPPECNIDVDDVIQLACDTSGFRQVRFSLITENVGSLGFDVLFMGAPVAHFEYGFVNYFISLPGNSFNTITIVDTEFPDCFEKWSIDVTPCLVPILCNYNEFNIDIEFECTSDTTYNAIIFVAYTGQDDSLYVYLNDQMAELRAIKDFPIIYPDILVSNDLFTFYAHEQDNVFCFNGTEWNDPPDCSNYTDCKITNVLAELHDCNINSNMRLVDIGFDVENPVSDSFIISGNGVIYDTFPYGQMFYTVGPIEVDCQMNFEFIVIDLEEPNCTGEFVFTKVPCCECDLYDIIVDPGNCTGDGFYELYLDFQYENVLNDFFDVFTGGQLVGTYDYDDLPITIDAFPEGDAEYDIITICDNDNPDCCIDYEFLGTDCIEEECLISNVFAESSLCNDAGNVFIDIEFIVQNPGNQGFIIQGNGVNYGTYQYGLATYTVGPVDGDCTTIYDIIIQDIENPDCSGFFEFDDPFCCDGECEIFNINVDPVECTGDGLYSLFLNFEYENVQDNIFDVYSGNTFIGSYFYSNLPVFIQSFPEREVEFDIITICDNDNPDCCTTIEFMGLDCMEDEEECLIFNLTVDPIECTGDGLYSVWIEFEFENPGNDFFEVFSGDNYVGTYPFSMVPLIIEEFPERDAEDDLITICVNDNELCCASLEFQGLDCEQVCRIWDIVIDPLECTGDAQYSIILDFEYEYNTNDFFEVFSEGTYLGLFAFDELPVTIDNFPERDSEYDIITVCQNDTDNCCDTLEFIGLDCTEEPQCLISDIEIELVECTGIGTYSMYLDFNYENVTNNFFDVYSDGNLVGFYAYADLPVFIEEFPERDSEFDFIVICDNDNPACCSGFEYPGLKCEEEENCEISEVFAEAGECDEAGEVFIDVEFQVENPGTMGFVIQGNGMIYDTFDYGQVFYTIGPVSGDCETLYEFIVRDLQNPDCIDEYVMQEEICCEMGICNIYDIVGEYYDCDSSNNLVYVDLAFEYENPGTSGFSIRGNGVIYDTFDYGEDYYTIGPLNADCMTVYEFIITDLEHPDCSDDFDFGEAFCCEVLECDIFDIIGEYYDCDTSSKQVFVELSFEYENPGTSGFSIRGNGVVYDTFDYGDDSYTIGPLDADCITIYEFIISDLEHPNCSDFFFFTEPLCCEEEVDCSIDSVVVIEADFIEDTYVIVLDVQYSGTENSGFDLYINEAFYSFHSHEDLPIILEVSIDEFESPFLITVCENDNSSCCNNVIFEYEIADAVQILPDDQFTISTRQQGISIQTDYNDEYNARLYSIEGQRLHSVKFKNEAFIESTGYASGIYILLIQSDSGIFTRKILLMH